MCVYTCYFMCVFFTASTTTCTDLMFPTSGMIAYNMETMNARPLNTVATYTCITGYTVTGGMTRNCGAGGMWSGTNPTCTRKYTHILLFLKAHSYTCTAAVGCGPLTALSNGAIVYTPDSTPILQGAMATHSCNEGYTGGGTRICQFNRMWSGSSLTCTRMYSN